jgi:DNA-binding NarL/FixJ family response regulator
LGVSVIANILFVVWYYNQKQSKVEDLKRTLSKQERIVLEHLLNDKTNKDIAEVLYLSVSTVKTHTNNIYKKLNVQSRDDVKSLFMR